MSIRGRQAQLVVAAMLVAVVTAPATQGAKPKLRCTSGTTLFVTGALRLFAGPQFTDSTGGTGNDEYSCFGAQTRPRPAGGTYVGTGVGEAGNPAYVYDGRRFLGTVHYDEGEGGADISYSVTDLKTGRDVASAGGSEFPSGTLRVAANGALVTLDGGEVALTPPGGGDGRFLSDSAGATDLALSGGTVYWTEGTVRSYAIHGVGPGPEDRVLEPVDIRPHGGVCAGRRGATIAASPSVRVFVSGGTRFLCRTGQGLVQALGGRNHRGLRIMGDRWLLTLDDDARVIDSRSMRVVTRVRVLTGAATLLPDGTLAWIDRDRGLLAQRPGATAPKLLAPAAATPVALASSRRTVYWTAGGKPHRWRRPA